MAIGVLVAIFGIANTLTASITDRRRELGVLRAVGGLRAQIRRTLWMEALSIGALGLILGLTLGAVNLYYILEVVHRDITGMRFNYTFPVSVAATTVPIILGAATPHFGPPKAPYIRRSWKRSSTNSRPRLRRQLSKVSLVAIKRTL